MSTPAGPAARVVQFTDPGCPESFALEPVRLRLRWLFGDQLQWEYRMAGLVRRRRRGEDELVPATVHACRAVVAVRLRWPEREDAMLRWLRVLARDGELLDDSDTLEIAAERAGLPVRELAAFAGTADVRAALDADLALADALEEPRSPAYLLDGRRVDARDLERALAGLERRPDPRDADEVLAWAPYPLEAAEVAAIRPGLR